MYVKEVKMKTIGIGLQKGGVGKTSITLALAASLSKTKKVLIVDADPQGNATCGLLKDVNAEFADVLFGNVNIEKAIIQSPFENIYILPTHPVKTRLREYKISGKVTEDIFLIEDELKKIAEHFDYCLIDTSPDFSNFEKNCFYACDEILPVMNCDTFGNDGLTIFLMNIDNFKQKRRKQNLEIKTIVLNRFNKSMKSDSKIKEIVEANKIYNYITIPQDQAVKDSQLKQILLNGKKETMEAIEKLVRVL